MLRVDNSPPFEGKIGDIREVRVGIGEEGQNGKLGCERGGGKEVGFGRGS